MAKCAPPIIVSLLSPAFLLAGCSDSDSSLLEDLSGKTLQDFHNAIEVRNTTEITKSIGAYLRENQLPDSEIDKFRICLGEYAYTKSGSIKIPEVLGWCANEYKNNPKRFASHVDIERFISLFSAWDGAFKPTEDALKKSLNDPDSYKHNESRYVLHLTPTGENFEPYATVETVYHAKNPFGAMMRGSVTVKVNLKTLDMKIIEAK